MNASVVAQPQIKKSSHWLGWVLVIVLLILRLPFLGGIVFFTSIRPAWIDPAFQILTYLFTAWLIWLERERLVEHHIDRLALWIILLFKPIQTLYLTLWGMSDHPLAFPKWPALCFWAISLGLLVLVWKSGTLAKTPQQNGRRNLLIGILAGLVMTTLLAYPMSFQVQYQVIGSLPGLIVPAFTNFFYQLGYAAVTEEPLFRGFLWGFLRRAGWKDLWILLFQALLFMFGHIYYLKQAPISFWIIVPVGALIIGLVAWRTRSLSASMAAHATANATGYMFGVLFRYFF